MATDKTEPAIKRIVGITVVSIVTLVGMRFGFQSYYLQSYEDRQHRVISRSESTLLADAQRESRGKLRNLAAAMDTAAGSNRPASVAPTVAPTFDALVGWGMLPTGFRPPPAPAAPAPAPAAPADADAAAPADAAVVPAPADADGAVSADAAAAPAAPAAAAPAAAAVH